MIEPGKDYKVLFEDRPNQGERPDLHPSVSVDTVTEVGGGRQYIVAGIAKKHIIHVSRGRIPIEERPMACLWLPDEYDDVVKQFVAAVEGMNMLLRGPQLNDARIVNWESSPFGGRTYDRSELQRRAAYMIKVYREWRAGGKVLPWHFRARVLEAKGLATLTPGLWRES